MIEGASDTDSATSSDSGGFLDTSDIAHLNDQEVDLYLFGEYQRAKKRWRRFTGKPVRFLRRTLRRKGKGKGKGKQQNAYLNIPEILEYYYKGKGKGKPTSGKGFGRKINPKDRNGQVMRCSTCGSMYHLRARCTQGPQGQNTNSSGSGQIQQASERHLFVQESTVHFAAFEFRSDASMQPTESETASWINVGALEQTPRPQRSTAEDQGTPDFPQIHRMTPNADEMPDPWMNGQDPWSQNRWSLQADPMMQWLAGNGMSTSPPAVTSQQPANLVQMAFNENTWNLPFMAMSSTRDVHPEQVQLPVLPQVTAMQQIAAMSSVPMDTGESSEVRPSRSLPLFYSDAAQSAGVSSLPDAPLPSSSADDQVLNAAANQVVSMFSEVHAARSRTSSHSEPRSAREAASSRQLDTQDAVRRNAQARPFSNQCTICQQVFNQGEEILRIECGHMFHSLCFSEMLQHTESEGNPSVCPNCRSNATVMSTWVYAPPSTPSQVARPVLSLPDRDPMSPLQAAINTPVPSEHDGEFADPEEFCTPEQAFAWWPVPDINAGPNAQDSFHATLDEGWGLLVDPGSYGNLVGDQWLEEMKPALYNQGKEIYRCKRDAPMHVGGVGKGSQHCVANCMFPLALQRTDGSMHLGDFTSPIVSGSRTPALLGLRSLMRHRAVLPPEPRDAAEAEAPAQASDAAGSAEPRPVESEALVPVDDAEAPGERRGRGPDTVARVRRTYEGRSAESRHSKANIGFD